MPPLYWIATSKPWNTSCKVAADLFRSGRGSKEVCRQRQGTTHSTNHSSWRGTALDSIFAGSLSSNLFSSQRRLFASRFVACRGNYDGFLSQHQPSIVQDCQRKQHNSDKLQSWKVIAWWEVGIARRLEPRSTCQITWMESTSPISQTSRSWWLSDCYLRGCSICQWGGSYQCNYTKPSSKHTTLVQYQTVYSIGLRGLSKGAHLHLGRRTPNIRRRPLQFKVKRKNQFFRSRIFVTVSLVVDLDFS